MSCELDNLQVGKGVYAPESWTVGLVSWRVAAYMYVVRPSNISASGLHIHHALDYGRASDLSKGDEKN